MSKNQHTSKQGNSHGERKFFYVLIAVAVILMLLMYWMFSAS